MDEDRVVRWRWKQDRFKKYGKYWEIYRYQVKTVNEKGERSDWQTGLDEKGVPIRIIPMEPMR